MSRGVSIELARREDLESLAGVERAAGTLFAGSPVASQTNQPVTSLGELAAAQRAGRLWVARGDRGEVVGFAQVDLVDGQPHLEEMAVHPDFGRRGIGGRLLVAVQDWARAAGHSRLTLTTFREIPWNGPFYARAGFLELGERELTPELREVVREEAARGLDPKARAVMTWTVR